MSEPMPCSWDGCEREAVSAVRFHDQPGHVHDCARHVAVLREWSDVAEVVDLPCPWADVHTLGTFTAHPKDLT